MQKLLKHITLAGNPNNGKSTLFTRLTGIYQKANNYPGVTVEKREGICHLSKDVAIRVTDLPGMYSLYPHGEGEHIAYTQLMCRAKEETYDAILVLVDASNLKRNLLLVSQMIDVGLPIVVCMTMLDVAKNQGIRVDSKKLSEMLGVPVVLLNPSKKQGIRSLEVVLRKIYTDSSHQDLVANQKFLSFKDNQLDSIPKVITAHFAKETEYAIFHKMLYPQLYHLDELPFYDDNIKNQLASYQKRISFFQAQDITTRYRVIGEIVKCCEERTSAAERQRRTDRIDNLLLHSVWGYVILFLVLMVCFQSIFYLAAYPMELIDNLFLAGSTWMNELLPTSWWSSLLVDGLWSGLNGILVFVPQIAMLSGIVAFLEDSGYMSRISFLMDRWTRFFGLSGKSVVAFANAFACAVPAIMCARNIASKQERMLTILVAPFMVCSARLPVYFILISIMVSNEVVLGFLSLQGLIMFALYFAGIIVAFIVSWALKFFVARGERSIFLEELPVYRVPYWKSAMRVIYMKSRIFVLEAGKIILLISMVIWVLSFLGPSGSAENTFAEQDQSNFGIVRAKDLTSSYMGHIGRWIEPVIHPLGYDWQIGVALLTSFAAREVFVGTVSTLYAVDADDKVSLITRMREASYPDGTLVYTIPTILSLLVFYALAMQCMSTMVIVYRETKSWTYPALQFTIMTSLAYILAWLTYTISS